MEGTHWGVSVRLCVYAHVFSLSLHTHTHTHIFKEAQVPSHYGGPGSP